MEKAFNFLFGDFKRAMIIISGGTLTILVLLVVIYLLASCSKKTQPKTSAAKGVKLNLPPGEYLLIENAINGVPGDTIRIISADTIKVAVK